METPSCSFNRAAARSRAPDGGSSQPQRLWSTPAPGNRIWHHQALRTARRRRLFPAIPFPKNGRLGTGLNPLSNGPHPCLEFSPLLAGAAHRPTRQGKISEELNQGASSGRLTVALHATAALTAVSRLSSSSSRRERRRSARTRSPSERGRFRRVKARHFPRSRREQPARTRLVNRYFPTLRLAPTEAPRLGAPPTMSCARSRALPWLLASWQRSAAPW